MSIRLGFGLITIAMLGGCKVCGEDGLFGAKECDTGDTSSEELEFEDEADLLAFEVSWRSACALEITVTAGVSRGYSLAIVGEGWTGEACDFDPTGFEYCKTIYNGTNSFSSVNDGYAGGEECGRGFEEMAASHLGKTIFTEGMDATFAFFSREGELLECQGGQCGFFRPDEDNDGDGVTTADGDCDDNDPSSTIRTEDGDCDGVVSEEDCDDTTAAVGSNDNDADCDGVTIGLDCNDDDPEMPRNDEDCDGVSTGDDCDDSDAESTVWSEDMDCDGLVTSDDCDDSDASMPNDDADCDGFVTAEDCDDADPTSTGLTEDRDCDGFISVDFGGPDCDDYDEDVHPGVEEVSGDGIDQDCDGSDVFWTQFEVAVHYGCAIDSEQKIHCWGEDLTVLDAEAGLLDPPSGAYSELAVGSDHACAIEADTGGIVCWGACVESECDAPEGPFIDVSVGGYTGEYYYSDGYSESAYTCGLRVGGVAECWGGPSSPVAEFTLPSLRFDKIEAWSGEPCAMTPADEGGEIYCFDGTDAPVLEGSFVDFSVSDEHGCATTEDGEISCWYSGTGSSSYSGWGTGLIPDGDGHSSVSVAPASGSSGFACSIDPYGRVDFWGPGSSSHSLGYVDFVGDEYSAIKVARRGRASDHPFAACALRVEGVLDCESDGYSMMVAAAPEHAG